MCVLEHEHGVTRKLGPPISIHRPVCPVDPRSMKMINDRFGRVADPPTLFMDRQGKIRFIK